MGVKTWTIVGGLALAIVTVGLPAAAEDTETSVFEMQEVSVFEQDDSDDEPAKIDLVGRPDLQIAAVGDFDVGRFLY